MKFDLNNYEYELNKKDKNILLKQYITSHSKPKELEIIPSSYIYEGEKYKIKLDEDCFRFTNIKKVKIEEGIEEIPEYCFAYSGIEKIELPNSLKSIGINAFFLSPLTEITIPNNVTNIGTYAFCNCKSLIKIKMSDNIINIGEYAFSKCENLTDIKISKNIFDKLKAGNFQPLIYFVIRIHPDLISVLYPILSMK